MHLTHPYQKLDISSREEPRAAPRRGRDLIDPRAADRPRVARRGRQRGADEAIPLRLGDQVVQRLGPGAGSSSTSSATSTVTKAKRPSPSRRVTTPRAPGALEDEARAARVVPQAAERAAHERREQQVVGGPALRRLQRRDALGTHRARGVDGGRVLEPLALDRTPPSSRPIGASVQDIPGPLHDDDRVDSSRSLTALSRSGARISIKRVASEMTEPHAGVQAYRLSVDRGLEELAREAGVAEGRASLARLEHASQQPLRVRVEPVLVVGAQVAEDRREFIRRVVREGDLPGEARAQAGVRLEGSRA